MALIKQEAVWGGARLAPLGAPHSVCRDVSCILLATLNFQGQPTQNQGREQISPLTEWQGLQITSQDVDTGGTKNRGHFCISLSHWGSRMQPDGQAGPGSLSLAGAREWCTPMRGRGFRASLCDAFAVASGASGFISVGLSLHIWKMGQQTACLTELSC